MNIVIMIIVAIVLFYMLNFISLYLAFKKYKREQLDIFGKPGKSKLYWSLLWWRVLYIGFKLELQYLPF